MAHPNIEERRQYVSKYIKSDHYNRRGLAVIAGHFGCTVAAILMDIVMINRKGNYTVYPSTKTKKAVLERDSYTCQYCGLKNGNICIDHIIPTSKGGVGYIYNLVACCNSCNIKKQNVSWIPNNHEHLRELNPEWFSRILSMST